MKTISDDARLVARLRAQFPNVPDEVLMRNGLITSPDAFEQHDPMLLQPVRHPPAVAVPEYSPPSSVSRTPRVAESSSDLDLIEVVHQAIVLRKQQGLTQRAFAAELGISVRTLQEWERGRRCPTQAARSLLQRYVDEQTHR
jgi:DNA-binding transcriptional regulator YiaG